jgi:transcriptional regulator with XRE-family HTH domain
MDTAQERISSLMEERGLTVKALAERAGIPRMTLTRRLADPRTFTLGEVDRIAAVLDVDPLHLLGEAAA